MFFFGRIEKYKVSKSGKFADDAQVPKVAAKKKFASKMRSIVSAVKVAQRLEVRCWISGYGGNGSKC